MKKQPLVSVIIPTYNRAQIIERTIDSVLNQSYKNWELIIVDDGSTDNTKKILKAHLKNKKIKYFYQKNQGVSIARNYGFKRSDGEYIAFLDSDDEFEKDKLKIQLKEMMSKKVDFSLSNRIEVIEETKIIQQEFNKSFLINSNDVISNKIPLSASLMMLKRDIMKKFIFDGTLPTSNDFDFILRLLNKYEILLIKNPLTKIHKTLQDNRISSNYDKKIKGYEKVLNKTKNNDYNLKKFGKNLMLKKLYCELGFFKVLNKETKQGRKNLIKGFNVKQKTKNKYYLIYLLSFFPFLIKFSTYLAKKIWKIGLLKN